MNKVRNKNIYDIRRKVLLWLFIAISIVGVIVTAVSFIPPDNPYFEMNGIYVTDTQYKDFFGLTQHRYVVTCDISNKTNKTLEIEVEIEYENIRFGEPDTRYHAFTLTVLPNETVNIKNSDIEYEHNTVKSIQFNVEGRSYTYNTEGTIMADFLLLFLIGVGLLSIFVPFLIAVIVNIIKQKSYAKSYNVYSERLERVQSQIQNVTNRTDNAENKELERLKAEKYQIEIELSKFRVCQYCGTRNRGDVTKCPNCGAKC